MRRKLMTVEAHSTERNEAFGSYIWIESYPYGWQTAFFIKPAEMQFFWKKSCLYRSVSEIRLGWILKDRKRTRLVSLQASTRLEVSTWSINGVRCSVVANLTGIWPFSQQLRKRLTVGLYTFLGQTYLTINMTASQSHRHVCAERVDHSW